MGGRSTSSFLFGSKGKSGKVVDVTPSQYTKLRNPISDALSGMVKSGGMPQYGGSFTAPLTGHEQNLLNGAYNASRPSQDTSNALDMLNNTVSGNYLSPSSNPFLHDAIQQAQDSVTRNFNQTVMPRLRSQATQQGQFVQSGGSSPFDRAAAIASQGLAHNLAGVASQMSMQNYQNERSNQLNAASQIPQIQSADLQRMLDGLHAQALPRLIQQHGIDAGLKEFRRQQDSLLQALKLAGGLSQPTTHAFQPTPSQPGLFQSALTSFAGGAGQTAGKAA